jgi:hypothetical protein
MIRILLASSLIGEGAESAIVGQSCIKSSAHQVLSLFKRLTVGRARNGKRLSEMTGKNTAAMNSGNIGARQPSPV